MQQRDAGPGIGFEGRDGLDTPQPSRGNILGTKGAAALAPSLRALTGPLALDLGGNALGTKAAETLSPALAKFTGLHALRLDRNYLEENTDYNK